MIKIHFPSHSFRIKNEKGKDIIFDECRKQWVPLSPEEWVRQNFLQYLIEVKGYPTSMIAVEKEISLGDLKKRFDVLVFKQDKPWMIIECKEMKVELSEAVIKQILNYNITIKAEYLVITNGSSTYAVYLKNGGFTWIDEIPFFENNSLVV
jgi:hypothetical protein